MLGPDLGQRVAAEREEDGLSAFWAAHMEGDALLDVLTFAHGAQFSVTKDQIRARHKTFYRNLIEDGLNSESTPHQAIFLEAMWAHGEWRHQWLYR